MKIILTKAIATEYLGAVPVGTGMDVSVSYADLLITRGFARRDDIEEGECCDGIIEEFYTDDEGSSGPTLAADSCSCSDGEDRPTE